MIEENPATKATAINTRLCCRKTLKLFSFFILGCISSLLAILKIKATMATSYMNDSATGYSIQKKLLEVAKILFINNNLLQEIGETTHETK